MPKMTLKNEGKKMVLRKIIAPKLKLIPAPKLKLTPSANPVAPNPEITA